MADIQCGRIIDKIYPLEKAGEGSKRWMKDQKISALIEGK